MTEGAERLYSRGVAAAGRGAEVPAALVPILAEGIGTAV
jgi:hypothetical protein